MLETAIVVYNCANLGWDPRIGDPSPLGWATVAAYLAAALLALGALARSGRFPAATRRRERAFWVLMALAFAALGVNKQLDLQSFLTAIGRCTAQAGGWYGERRLVQAAFVAVLAGLTLAALLGALRLFRGTLRRQGIALVGLAFVAGFVLVRAVGFHHVDALINARVSGLRMNWVLELGGIALVALGALRVLIWPAR